MYLQSWVIVWKFAHIMSRSDGIMHHNDDTQLGGDHQPTGLGLSEHCGSLTHERVLMIRQYWWYYLNMGIFSGATIIEPIFNTGFSKSNYPFKSPDHLSSNVTNERLQDKRTNGMTHGASFSPSYVDRFALNDRYPFRISVDTGSSISKRLTGI